MKKLTDGSDYSIDSLPKLIMCQSQRYIMSLQNLQKQQPSPYSGKTSVLNMNKLSDQMKRPDAHLYIQNKDYHT